MRSARNRWLQLIVKKYLGKPRLGYFEFVCHIEWALQLSCRGCNCGICIAWCPCSPWAICMHSCTSCPAVVEAHYCLNDGQNNVVTNFCASLPSRLLQATRVKIVTQCLAYCFLEYTYYCAQSLWQTSLLKRVTPLDGGLYPENSTSDMLYDTVDFL